MWRGDDRDGRGLVWILVVFITTAPLATAGSAPQVAPVDRDGEVISYIPEATSYDGETIFRGLFFGLGRVAEIFPEIWDGTQAAFLAELSDAELEEVLRFQDRLIALMGEADPSFLARFAQGMQSGDHLRVRDALNEAWVLLDEVLQSELGEAMDKARNPNEPEATFLVFTAVAAVVAAFVFVVVNVDTAVNIRAFYDRYGAIPIREGGEEEKARLQREMWIDAIAQRLSPAVP